VKSSQLKQVEKVKIEDSAGKTIRFDASTDSMQTIDYAHHEVHSGSHYFVAGGEGMNLNEVSWFSVDVPATDKEPHMTWGISSSKMLTFEVFEDSNAINGELISARNSNRRSANTSGLTIRKNPGGTILASGEIIELSLFGAVGGNKVQSTGGEASREAELILKSNTQYLFRITSFDNTNLVSWRAAWYEHTPRG
jgi:hypothetical protein